ncbi:MAG: DUF1080 domain-containing protein [Chitinophagaceae bacterium]|jgi:hypothetical protein|nr:DUF1080 domain-containing protein [Chitinophagaceae bacterium]
MKRFLSILAVSILLTNLSFGQGNSSGKKGWIKLSDGKTFTGWHTYGKTDVSSAWSIDNDGAFHLTGRTPENKGTRHGGDLVTDEAYENFELSLEWKISKGGNSGIIFLVQDDRAKYQATYITGPEMQVLDNVDAEDNKLPSHLAGALYDLIDAKTTSNPKPVGEWNKAEIKLLNGKLELKLNGTVTASVTMWTDEWNQLVAKSKFATWADFAKFKSGHIALQDHGGDVWFRNIKIRKL